MEQGFRGELVGQGRVERDPAGSLDSGVLEQQRSDGGRGCLCFAGIDCCAPGRHLPAEPTLFGVEVGRHARLEPRRQ